jgi:hypothetical protein
MFADGVKFVMPLEVPYTRSPSTTAAANAGKAENSPNAASTDPAIIVFFTVRSSPIRVGGGVLDTHHTQADRNHLMH